ncbi:LOW QUALITY PROTEIN: chitin-binding domain protein cbd-1 [Drosophila gunungcola]|uniref:LOW QUALITY PROTEIN: chitin-binding domain protein cbd-1 n=1 Tax=Drosophila gunungcola TaxID=103775 RepID=UPI0022E0C918|nr:LOW QUALITY PROTEIN: chitin-binding domain protein cbd-1 [Drosophila gunungcola]
MSFKVQFSLCLVLLIGVISSIQGEVFPQCANADVDTFVMAIDDCASYIYCNGVDSFRDSCPESTYFDDRTQECAFDDAGVCLRESISVSTEELPDQQASQGGEGDGGTGNSTPGPTPPSQDISTASSSPDITNPSVDSPPSSPAPSPSSPAQERPHCDTTGDGDHPHPQRCEYFYRCLGGYLTIVRCPYKYGWDFPTKQCQPITEAQCFRNNS